MGEGAGAVVFSRTLSALAARGHEVRVSLPLPEDTTATGPVDEAYEGFTLHRRPPSGRFVPRARLPLVPRLWERWRSWKRYQAWGTHAALAVAREHRPDLVVGYGAFEAPVAFRVGRALGVPNITRLFGTWLNLESRVRYYLNFPEIVAFRTPADLWIVTNDGSNGERAARSLSVPRERLVFLRNGLDFERFSPGPSHPETRARLGLATDAPLILAVGRLAFEKKVERAIDALPAVLERHPAARLVLLGDGPDRAGLEDHARARGLAASVHFEGAVRYEDLVDWYRSADLFVSLLDRTNAANPTFEALACGGLVLALDTGTTRDVIQHDVNGWLVSPSALSRLGTEIGDLLADRERAARLREAAAPSIRALLPSPQERLGLEIELYETVARRAPIPLEWTSAKEDETGGGAT